MFWDMLPEICSSILWHENNIGDLRNLFTHSGGVMGIFYVLEGDHEFLPSWNISNHPSPQYMLTTLLPNRISSIFYIQNKFKNEGMLTQQLCGECSFFSIAYCLDNNYMYHMTKCYLLLVVCSSWNHNIDASLCITKVLMCLSV